MRRITTKDVLTSIALFIALAWGACISFAAEPGKCCKECPCAAAKVAPVKPVGCEDPSGFTQALNVMRVQQGLSAVTYDAGLNAIGKQNNDAQAVKGQGHHDAGNQGQCAYVGPRTCFEALFGFRHETGNQGIGYIHSPGHYAVLFHPRAKRVGVSHNGQFNTIVIAF